MDKNKHAVAMGRKRWLNVPPEERSRLAKAAVDARERKRAVKDPSPEEDASPNRPVELHHNPFSDPVTGAARGER